MTTTILIEQLDLSEAQFDTDNRVLRNVGLIRAGKSLNKRFYSEDVLQKSVSVFEGAKAFDSHASGEKRERRVGELTGWYENVRFENGVVKADRHFLPTTAGKDVMSVVEAIKNGAPRTLAGLSINAVGTGKMQKMDDGDYLHVESITSANSVDDVVNPAAGGSYTLTASNGDDMAAQLVNAMTFEEFFESRPDFIKRIQNEMKTVRQDDALKAAKAEAEAHQTALKEAQDNLTALQTAHEAAVTELATARRELAIEKALRAAMLPALYETDLRNRLSTIAEAEWTSMIEIEKKKAQQTVKPRVAVTGAGQQVHVQPIIRENAGEPKPLDMNKISTPEQLAQVLSQYAKEFRS